MSSEQEFKCVFCREAFFQKEDLQIHFRKHGDPNFNQKKQFERSHNDADTPAEKQKDQNMEVVECEVCPEVFTTISKAITHKHKVHPDHDTKYFCPWCGKLFTMKHLFKKHIQATHKDKVGSEDKLFHCDSCEVDFNGFAAMNHHNKFYHRQDDLPILGHSKKLKMILEEVVQIYYCPFCGEENDNKVNLHKHINEDHNSENQRPNDVFRCPLCDAIFYYLDAYELHLTYHSREDLYTERNPLMDEVTEFSLETVQPLEENIESAEPNHDQDAATMKIEDLLEFTMSDSNDTRKSKKRKKHKKSKKPAITLDEFLSMNKDVFGEGIDFQGVEEVPTQVIAKRFKTKKASTSQSMSPDIMKLKKQGIVVKKQATKTRKPPVRSNETIKTGLNVQKNIKPTVQAKSNALTSTDAVLSKLLNQGSQIKIVKKTNHDSKEPLQQKQDNTDQEKSTESMVDKNDEANDVQPDFLDAERKNIETIQENKNIENSEMKSSASSPIPSLPGSPSLISCNKDIDNLQKSDEDTNNIANRKDFIPKNLVLLQKPTKLTDNITALQNNTSITLKLPKQNVLMKDDTEESNNVEKTNVKESHSQENTEKTTSASTSENSSLNALKHLSHLITVKSVNSTKVTSNSDMKPENSSHKAEGITKASPNVQNNCSKKSEGNHFSNIKNLDSITIKSTIQSNLSTLKNHSPVAPNDNFNEHNESDEEWHDDNPNTENKIDTLAPSAESLQLSIQTKHSPKTMQKESPKVLSNDHNSQSSVDLLKHLKNVTAKPLNPNSQKIPTPQCSPSSVVKNTTNKTLVQKEISEDGTEIFSIDDSDSDEGYVAKNRNVIKTESKIEPNKSFDVPKTIYKTPFKSINQQCEKLQNKNIELKFKKVNNNSNEDYEFEKETHTSVSDNKFSSPTPNQKNVANVLKNLSSNITIKSRNSSPNLTVQSQEHSSRDSYLIKTNEADSDSDTPLNSVKITEMENMSDDELPEENAESDDFEENVKIEHPDDIHSDHDEVPTDEEPDGMVDIESQIATSKLQKDNTFNNTKLTSFKKLNKDLQIKSSNNTNNSRENSPTDEIPSFAKNLSNQISIKQIKKPENKIVEEAAQSVNQSSVNQKMATSSNQVNAKSSNQVNTFNKEVKTVKQFQTQTKTVIQEITTTVTKTIKTVNQTTKQEVRNMAQSSSSSPTMSQKIQGIRPSHVQNNYQGMKVRQSTPCIRPKIRGQAPQTMRPAICPPPQAVRPAICSPPQAVRPAICGPRANQLVPVRPGLNRPCGPRSRMPNVNVRPSTSGQQRPQMTRPVKVSPQAVFTSPKNVETLGHFSCFKKPKESLIPEPEFATTNMADEDSTVQISSTMQLSKSNFSSTSKIVKGNSVVKSTQMKSEMCTSSQQLSKLRGVSGLVVKSSQAKQTQVEEKSEMSASKRNTLEAIQKLQSQGLLVKKPRLDVSEDSDHSQHDSDDMEHDYNEEFNE